MTLHGRQTEQNTRWLVSSQGRDMSTSLHLMVCSCDLETREYTHQTTVYILTYSETYRIIWFF